MDDEAMRGRVPALDGVRGLAVLAVLLLHFHVLFYVPLMGRAGWSRWEAMIFAPLSHGEAGVDLFFALSGFLITGILRRSRGRPGYFRNFYIRRALRIFPAYYAMLFFAFFIAPALPLWAAGGLDGMRREWPWAVTYLSNFRDAAEGRWMLEAADGSWTVAHAWSLAIEEQFYFVWPVLIAVLSRRAALGLCVATVVAASALRLGLYAQGAHLAAYTLMPCRADALAAGAWVAIVAERGAGRLARPARVVFAMAATALLCFYLVVSDMRTRDYVRAAVGQTIQSLGCAALVAMAITAAPGSMGDRLWASRPLRTLGKFSYGLYLFHFLLFPVFHRLGAAVPVHNPIVARVAGIALCFVVPLALSLAVAWLSWNLLERPFVVLKDRLAPATPAAERLELPVRLDVSPGP